MLYNISLKHWRFVIQTRFVELPITARIGLHPNRLSLQTRKTGHFVVNEDLYLFEIRVPVEGLFSLNLNTDFIPDCPKVRKNVDGCFVRQLLKPSNDFSAYALSRSISQQHYDSGIG